MADVAEAQPSLGVPAAAIESDPSPKPAEDAPKPAAAPRSFSMSFGGSSPKAAAAAEEGGSTAKTGPAAGFSQWARGFRLPSSLGASSSSAETPKASPFSMLTSGFGKRVPSKAPADETPSTDASSVEAPEGNNTNAFDTFTKGFLDSSRNAVRTVQLKARHLVSQNKRRYQVPTSSFLLLSMLLDLLSILCLSCLPLEY